MAESGGVGVGVAVKDNCVGVASAIVAHEAELGLRDGRERVARGGVDVGRRWLSRGGGVGVTPHPAPQTTP